MNATSPLFGRNRNRGSAFITVMLFSTVLLLILAGLLNLSLTERKLNQRNAYWLEARNAAQAVAEYGLAQVQARYQNYSTPPSLDPNGANPLSLPDAAYFGGTHINTTAYSSSNPNGMQLIAGTNGQYQSVDATGAPAKVVIDLADPGNNMDPLKGKPTRIRNVQIVSKATCVPNDGSRPVTCYVRTTLMVRLTPFLTNAIFYNANDLEIFPGPNFDIYGPVQVNGNIFASAQGSTLSFHDTVTASGELYHAWSNQRPAADGSGSEALGSTTVNFATSTTGLAPLQDPTTHIWEDSTNGTDSSLFSAGLYVDQATAALTQLTAKNQLVAFKNYAHSTWNNFVTTGSMGATVSQPVSYTSPIDAAGDLPDPHTMIEPPTPPATSDPYVAAKTEVEKQKISTGAGLYIKVVVSGSTATITAYGPQPTTGPISGTPNGGPLINLPSSGNLVKFVGYSGNSSNVNSGIYDRRQAAGVNLVQVDMAQLNAALASTNAPSTPTSNSITMASGAVWGNGTTTDPGWNGGVYVDVTEPSTPGAGVTQTGVILVNGAATSGTRMIPSQTNSAYGLTVGTNAPVYVLGNFNADGTIATGATGSATTPDDGHTDLTSSETLTAIYADAITLLSPNYFGTASTAGGVPNSNISSTSAKSVTSSTTTTPKASADIEVAAAMITGLVPTGSTASSGGVHNLPRFLEDWTTASNAKMNVAIRGSLVAMYNSKTAIGKWNTSYYGPPNRVWGYDRLFKAGYFPPLSKGTLDYRRVQSSLSASPTEYVNAVTTLYPLESLYQAPY